MAEIIDTSLPQGTLAVSGAFGGLTFVIASGFSTKAKYSQADVASVQVLDEETFRHGGKAVAGAVIGGVLTGGIGLLAGAALGGRRRKEGAYLVRFSDGNYLAFKTTDKKVIAKMQPFIIRAQMNPPAAPQS